MSDDTLPEPDRLPGAPHPRDADRVLGQNHAVQDFLSAAQVGRLHHGWLLTGPRGTGKATLAWAMAKWLLSEGDTDSLQTDPDAPVVRRIRALSEPRLQLIRKPVDEKTGRIRTEITVDEIRRLQSFFHMSAAEGGRRVAIIDAADEMNTAAANALLKQLEEPPRDATLILIAHQPGRLLPTIRSRCRELRLQPLPADDMAQILSDLGIDGDAQQLSALAGGSVGEAVRLAAQDGLPLYRRIVQLFADYPRLDRRAAAGLAETAAGRATADGDPFDLMVTLLDRFLTRAARTGLLGAPFPEAAASEAEVLTRISPDPQAARLWATAQAELSARARAGRAVNLDPSALVMDMLIGLANQPAR
ncbi:DNA polymerase III subunit delta' [Paracoccus shanxieyensis]|uniref:DNA polymerase III subunit delta n=1 Tax=Paracoccus shanxieyensis TaxID=2675752 RepID=A0A6L6IZH6_9RHOB|nr:DNA polymerase III subunit delta' [Paracoccus shanxieyensis]MTH65011.1 DNA polymerase III subunit delta' [Paracoccus shanxieyensis]MTH88085.1 DNA polymerase III subunit delta' [Paracoccus shanxieyensis]